MLICTVCGTTYLPWHRWWEDCCQDCHTYNFAASQELRIHEDDAPLTPRQRAALVRMRTPTPRREDDHAL